MSNVQKEFEKNMSKFAEADQPVFDYLSQIEESLTETKQMLEEAVTLVYSYLSLPQHTDPHALSIHCIFPKTSFHNVHIATCIQYTPLSISVSSEPGITYKLRDWNQAAILASVQNHPACAATVDLLPQVISAEQ